MNGSSVTELGSKRTVHPPSSGGNGNGVLTSHRLTELERRMGIVESKVDNLVNTCTRIETKLDTVASKSYVLWIFGGTSAVLVLTLVGHAVVRTLVAG